MLTHQPPGGPLIWLTNIPTPYRAALWRALAARSNLRVYCLAASEENRHWDARELASGLDLHVLDAPRIETRAGTFYLPHARISRAVERSAAGIVLDGWESPAFQQALLRARRLGVPVVASYRSTSQTHRFHRGPVAGLRRLFFRRVGAVLTAGPASTAAVAALGVPIARIVTAVNAVDVRAIHDGATAFRKGFQAASGHRFLYVGQLIRRKNLESLLAAFAQARQPADELVMVGSGPELDKLQKQARLLGIEGAVRFLGELHDDDLVAAYATAHTFVLPSTQEVWGLVVNEALAAGLHAVVSNTAGIAPSIQHMNGVLLAAPTTDELAAAMTGSRASWTGWIGAPEMLRHTPEAAAAAVWDAVGIAASAVRRRD